MNKVTINDFQEMLDADLEENSLLALLSKLRSTADREDFAGSVARQPLGSWSGWSWY
jgi:hypothetical protein